MSTCRRIKFLFTICFVCLFFLAVYSNQNEIALHFYCSKIIKQNILLLFLFLISFILLVFDCHRCVSSTMFEHTEDVTWSTPWSARQSSHIVSHEDVAIVWMRKTSTRNRMGRQLHSRSNQWYFYAIDFVLTMSSMSTLFSAKYGFVQRKITRCIGKCGTSSVASTANHAHQFKMFGRIVRRMDGEAGINAQQLSWSYTKSHFVSLSLQYQIYAIDDEYSQ